MQTEQYKQPLLTDDGELIEPQLVSESAPQAQKSFSLFEGWWTIEDAFGIVGLLLIPLLTIAVVGAGWVIFAVTIGALFK